MQHDYLTPAPPHIALELLHIIICIIWHNSNLKSSTRITARRRLEQFSY